MDILFIRERSDTQTGLMEKTRQRVTEKSGQRWRQTEGEKDKEE